MDIGSAVIPAFVASAVEVTEMVVIVVGVGAARGWRSTWFGSVTGLVVLAAIVAGLGTALRNIPIDIVRIVIGFLLLTFGLQWLRKGIIQVAKAGLAGGGEDEGGADERDPSERGVDWTAFVLAFKGVLLEGLEVAFLVVAFGAGARSYTGAFVGAAAAFVVIGGIGFGVRGLLERVPGRTLKYGAGCILTTFGMFWALEGLGVHWPGDDVSLAWLFGYVLALAVGLTVWSSRQDQRAAAFGGYPPREDGARRSAAEVR